MRKALLILSALVLGLGVSSAVVPNALAYRGNPNTLGPNCTSERHNQIINAIKNNDYNAWKDLMDGRGVTRRITEQNFKRFAEMVRLRLERKIEEANKIKAELGLGIRKGFGFRQGYGYKAVI